MVLYVQGNPRITAERIKNKVMVEYDPDYEVTTITIGDIDIVTLGVAVEILTMQYKNVLSELEPSMYTDVVNTIRKAVGSYGQNPDKNNQSKSNRRS